MKRGAGKGALPKQYACLATSPRSCGNSHGDSGNGQKTNRAAVSWLTQLMSRHIPGARLLDGT